MLLTQSELLKSQNSTGESTQATSSVPNEQLAFNEMSEENSNFWIRGNSENGYFITVGNQMVCEPQPTVEQCKTLIASKDWNLIMNVVLTILNNLELAKENANRTNQQQ